VELTMFNKFDRFLFKRLTVISIFILAVLLFIFIILDFSNNSDDFADRGAEFYEIFTIYYANYIPEMTRLVMPEAVFIACLILTGQLSERLEIASLKAAGVSLYRLLIPYLIFAILVAGIISYLDSSIIPQSNTRRIAFGEKYLKNNSQYQERNNIYRQLSPQSLILVNYYNPAQEVAYKVSLFNFENDSLKTHVSSSRMEWIDSTEKWILLNPHMDYYRPEGVKRTQFEDIDTTLNVLPRDLARSSSDVYQLTYEETRAYIDALERSGAGGVNQPKVQYFGRLFYPLSVVVVTLIGFSIASVRRRGGKGFYIAAGLIISFFYLAFMKLAEPFGSSGVLKPYIATLLPHLFFLLVGLLMLILNRK